MNKFHFDINHVNSTPLKEIRSLDLYETSKIGQ